MSTIIGRASAKLIFALLVSFLGLFYIVNAEEGVEEGVSAPEVVAPSPASDTSQQANETAVTDGRFLCSDQYRRNSIGVNIYTNHSTVVAGTPLSFTGEIENKNSYPITSGEVWVKVYQVENASDATKRKRTNQVAYFKAIDNLTIKAYAKEAVNFSWTPSAGLLGGDYDATYHFLSNDHFYHFGLPYLDEQGGSYTTFKVEGTDQGTVYFDRESIKLNNVPYDFSATTPAQFGDQEIVFVQGALVNPTAEERLVEVTWKTSAWGQTVRTWRR